jgi:hypothetical protein
VTRPYLYVSIDIREAADGPIPGAGGHTHRALDDAFAQGVPLLNLIDPKNK